MIHRPMLSIQTTMKAQIAKNGIYQTKFFFFLGLKSAHKFGSITNKSLIFIFSTFSY